MTSYVSEIKSLDKEIKRLTKASSELRKKKKETERNLYNHMKSHNIESIGDYRRDKLAPKQVFRKKKAEIKAESIRIMYEVGIPDPNAFWSRLQHIQKHTLVEDGQNKNE